MAYRKKIENWLENDCKFWDPYIKLELVDSNCSGYVWHLYYQNNIFEITYNDISKITLRSFPKRKWAGSNIREIYVGDGSMQSFLEMIEHLQNNLIEVF